MTPALPLAELFQALADSTRLRILALLREMELSVGELAQLLAQSQPRVSRHIKILCDSGLVERRKEGSWVFLALGRRELADALFVLMDSAEGGQATTAVFASDKARLAAVRHTERDGDQLRSTLTDSRRLLEARDSRGASAANLAFHEAVGQASGNPLLLANIVGLHSQLRRLFRTTPQLQRDHVDEHELILDAILARDPGRAEALSRSHLQSATAATMALFEG